MSEIDNEFVEQVAVQIHCFHADDDSSKWAKQTGRYRTQMRRDVRDALSALDRLGYAIEKRRSLAAKDAEIEKLKAALKQIAGESGQFGFPWPETHVDYPAFALLTARAALKGDAQDQHAAAKAYLASRPDRAPTQTEIDDDESCGGFV